MCGICGRYNLDGRPVTADEIVAMRDTMVHRGPDDQGIFVAGAVGLGHRRLSIIDLSGGHQPISNEDGTITVVFNGEIYNFAEIRAELLARGHTFTSRSDTEVIVHLYEELGPDCLQRFIGMFAIALWDARRQRLFLARDRLGVKPLYYAHRGDALWFASEIKGVLRAPELPAEIDRQGLRRYLTYRFPYGEATLFKDVRQLPPGHWLIAEQGRVTVRRYWDVPEREVGAAGADAGAFLPLLDDSVRLRMISDVPIGSFLSGGVDSSAITALMARHTDRVRTFSVGFIPDEESELGWAKRVAEHCRAQHHEFVLGSEDFFSLLQRLVWHNDEPLMFPASIPLYLLSRESKREATVMLGGEGADEILAGYGTDVRAYWLNRLSSAVPHGLRRALAGLQLPGRLGSVASRAALTPSELILDSFRLADSAQLIGACRLQLPGAAADDEDLQRELGLGGRSGTFLDRLLYFQLKTYLVALLMKQDKMSMAASIETRVPYLDHRLVSLALSLPDRDKIRGRTGKHLLKRVSEQLLPRDVVYRRKQGFPVPIARWMQAPGNPFVELLLDAETLRDGLLEADWVKSRVARFRAGAGNSMELWAMLNLELWRREYLTAAGRQRAGMAA